MPKLLRNILVFFLPIFIVIIGGEILLRHIPNDYVYKRDYLNAHSNDLQVLFLGNSHMYNGVNPSLLPYKAFNASHPAQTLEFDLNILNRYKDSLENLDCIVLSMDYLSIYFNSLRGGGQFREKNYKIYYNFDFNLPWKYRFEISSFPLKNNITRFLSYYTHGTTELLCNQLGWGTKGQPLSGTITELSISSAKLHTAIPVDIDYIKYNIRIIDSFIAIAQDKNIKIIFLCAPAYKEYRDHLDPTQLKITTCIIKDKVSGYKKAYFYNLLASTEFDQSDFHDADHLNKKGSVKLTHMLDSLIRL